MEGGRVKHFMGNYGTDIQLRIQLRAITLLQVSLHGAPHTSIK